MKEIERKFLADKFVPSADTKYIDIQQGYLCSDKAHVVRVRVESDKAWLTVKGPDEIGSFTHLEVEKELTLEEGQALLKICEPGIITKRRYLVPCKDGKHTFEVDVFGGKNTGVVLAEIELENESEQFDRPDWLGENVTGKYQYSNINLIKRELGESGNRKIVYIDMDGVLVDFQSGVDESEPFLRKMCKNNPDYIPGVFNLMKPMPGAIEAVHQLNEKFDLYILSTASWNNPLCWMEKRQWVGRYFGDVFHKKLILTHRKDLNEGDYLIDDRDRNGAADFKGELIRFGTYQFPNWKAVTDYLMQMG